MQTVIANKYRILRELGHGAVGRVFEAQHLALTGRRVALKLINPQYLDNAELASRWAREARLTATLQHPGIVHVLDVEFDAVAGPVVVMELLHGLSLDRFHERRGVSARQAVDFVIQVLDALQYAHDQKVVHRDIKPANLFVVFADDADDADDKDDERVGSDEPRIKILDFGIAHAVGESRLTVAGAFLGTPVYASPEQRLDSTRADAASDVYSVGVTLFELLIGDASIVPEAVRDLKLAERALRAAALPDRLVDTVLSRHGGGTRETLLLRQGDDRGATADRRRTIEAGEEAERTWRRRETGRPRRKESLLG